MKTLMIGAALSAAALAATPAFAAGEEAPFRFLQLETDYADWGSNKREATWEGEGWIGGDVHKAWLKTEGEWGDGDLEEAEVQLLYSRSIAAFWDAQIGIRHDFRPDPTNYLTVALNGLAPYFFETDFSLFLSDEADASLRTEAALEILITQTLIAEPYLEANFYAQDVPEQDVGAGLSDIDAGLRIRYEIVREFAPYVDFNYVGLFGESRNFGEEEGQDPNDVTVRFGVRFWLN